MNADYTTHIIFAILAREVCSKLLLVARYEDNKLALFVIIMQQIFIVFSETCVSL